MVDMIPTTINGRWTLKLPEHRAARAEWVTGWERERLDSMCATLRPGDVIYDIGAEEGDLPALWATWGCEVALFEPNPRVWANIKAIWEANELPGPLATFLGFAGDITEPGYGEFGKIGDVLGVDGHWPSYADGPLIGDHGFCNLWERPDLAKIRLDDFAPIVRPPDAITIDVEGSEAKVMAGAGHVLEKHRPVVWVSVHPAFMADMYDQTPEDLFDLMLGHGYERELLAIDHEHHYVFWHAEGRRPVSA